MQCLHVSLCFLLVLSWISIIAGLQCPSCTYLTTTANIPGAVRTIIEGILSIVQDKECSQDLKGPIPEIQEETCVAIDQQAARCTFYKGSVTVTVPLLITSVDVPLQIYQRGCHHFRTANVPSIGCHRRDNINEDKTVIKQFLDKISSTFEDYEIAKFEGEMCVCTDTYCKDTSGSKGSNVNTSLLFLSVMISFFYFKK